MDEYVPTSPRRHHRTARPIPSTSPIAAQSTTQTSKAPTTSGNPATLTTSVQPSLSSPSSTRRGKNRPPGYVPRPPNAFIVFRSAFIDAGRLGRPLHLPSLNFTAPSDTRHTHSQKPTTSHQQELSKNAAVAWNALSQEDRRPYQEEANRRNEAQRREHPGWKYGRGAARVVKGGSAKKKRAVAANYRQAKRVDGSEHTCAEAKSLVQVVPIPTAADHVKTATRTTAKPFTQLSQSRANSGALPKAKQRAKAKALLLERPPYGPKSKSRFFAGPSAKPASTSASAQPATSVCLSQPINIQRSAYAASQKANRASALPEKSPIPTIKLPLRPRSPSVFVRDSASHSEDQSALRLGSESKSKSLEATEQGEEDLIPELTSIWWSTTVGSSAFIEANQRGFPEGLSASQIGSPSVDPLFPFTDSSALPSSASDAPSSDTVLEPTATTLPTTLNKTEISGQTLRQSSPAYTYPGPSPYPRTLTLADSTWTESKWAGPSSASLSSTHPSCQDMEAPFDPVAYSMSMAAASRLELSDWDFGMSMEVDEEACRGELSIEMFNWKDGITLSAGAGSPKLMVDPSSLPVNGSDWASPPSLPSLSSSSSSSCWISDLMALEDGE